MDCLELATFLRCPVDQLPLFWREDCFVQPTSGRRYPKSESGIIDLVAEEERFADLGDDRHYDEHPFEFLDWADERWVKDAVEPELKRFLEKISRDKLVCDVGCGAGRVSAYLEADGRRRVLSIDYSRVSLDIVRKNVSFPIICANNLNLPLASESVDAVISTGVIHHTPDPLKALSENYRILKKGGRMYLRVYRFASYYHFLHLSIGMVMRILQKRSRIGRVIVDDWLFYLYCRASSFLKVRRTKEKRFLRALFQDYFLNTQTAFIPARTIRSALTDLGAVFKRSKTRTTTDLYLVEKPRRG